MGSIDPNMSFGGDLDPRTRGELLAALLNTQGEVHRVCAQDGATWFFNRPENGWSGAEHLTHLVTSVNAVAKGLSMKRFVLRILFGRARVASRSFVGLRETYQARLAGGGRASGRFVPRPGEPPVEEVAAGLEREALLGRWQRAVGRLEQGLEGWDEASLDRYRLPHPLLAKLTVREMLFFTIYHNLHHAHRVDQLHQMNC